MACTIWATSDVPQDQRFDYYRSGLCASFVRLSPEDPKDDLPFDAAVHQWEIAGRQATLLLAPTHRVVRSRRDVAEADDSHLYLNFPSRGILQFDQFGCRRRVDAGGMVLVDNAYPFDARICRNRGQRLFVQRIDRSVVGIPAPQASERLATHDLSPALRNTLSFLAAADPDWEDSLVAETTAIIERLVRVILSVDSAVHLIGPACLTASRVRAAIARHFADPTFSLDAAASEIGMTRRTLQHHLSLRGLSFSRLLNDYRTARAQEWLASETDRDRSVEQIGFACGFQDVSTFYRAFKRHAGRSPGALRRPKTRP